MDQSLLVAVFHNLFCFQSILGLFIGTFGGIIIGALPGLGSTMGIAILIPVTFTMEPTGALIMLTSLYTASMYGGSISAILLHTPGTPASAATAMDGYELTKQGKGLQAIGITTTASMFGGTISAIFLLLIAPPLAKMSLRFNAPENFFIAIFGLTIIGSLSSDNMSKGLLSGCLGLSLSCIGIDPVIGLSRFTYGQTALESGISMVPALIGLFSFSQVMIQAERMDKIRRGEKTDIPDNLSGKVVPPLVEVMQQIPNIIRSAVIGVFVGILPGAGGDIGSWVGYNEAKRFSKDKAKFGKGSKEAIWASEAANNAVTGGALIPLLTLGIPGSSATAVLLGGLLLQGLQPGHALFSSQADITYAIIIGFMISNILMGVVGFLTAKHLVKVAKISTAVLAPIIIVFSVIGSYAISTNFFDVVIMLIFGVIGYFMRKAKFPTAPVVLGIILGPLAEQGYLRSLAMAKGLSFFSFFIRRPICLVLITLILLSLLAPIFVSLMHKKYEK